MKYRYRNDQSTHRNEVKFDVVLPKLGRIKYVKGYRYFGRYHTSHEAVLVVGENGSARFGGLNWGYGGQGPRGLHGLLLKLGVPAAQAWEVAFQTPRLKQLGEDWRVSLVWTLKTAEIKKENEVPSGSAL